MLSTNSQQSSIEQDRKVMLSARQLFCERGERVLFQQLDFELREGQVLQVQGSNGSGKTTLMRILCGLNDSYQGAVYWYGEEIEKQTDSFFASLLYIGHRVGVSKVLTPLENLRWSCGLKQQVNDKILSAALAEVGLRGFEDFPCYTLSAGQQQRVSLARLVVIRARLWVLDEPFTTLDARGVKQLEALVQAQASSGGAVMITTHHKLDIPELQFLSLG